MAVKTKTKRFDLPKELTGSMITGKFRVSYQHMLEPWAADEESEPRYSIQMIFDNDDPFLKEMKTRVKKIAVAAFGKNAVRLLRTGKLKNPFRNGDDEFPDQEEYKGKTFVNANGSFEGKGKPPGLIDQMKRPIRKMEDPDEVFYSGCYARAEIRYYPFATRSTGIACWLFNVQKMANGEPLGGGRKAEDVFDEVEGAEDEDFLGIDEDEDDDF